MTTLETAHDALHRAQYGQSGANYVTIFEGFMAKGIPMDDIHPRENVFTFNAWRALGRVVRKGEHGVKILTWVPMTKKVEPGTVGADASGKVPIGRRPKSTTVFHISQTDPIQ